MGLDMSIIRKRKQKFGKAKIFPFEKPFVRYYYKDGKSIDFDFPKNNHFVYKASKVKKSDYYEDIYELAYWRKFNALHKWFVDNVQDGNDDCGDYRLTKAKLEEILEILDDLADNIILKNGTVINGYIIKRSKIFKKYRQIPNKEKGKVIKNWKYCRDKLPTYNGTMFGSLDYNEYYYNNVVSARDRIREILQRCDVDNEEIYYSSSW